MKTGRVAAWAGGYLALFLAGLLDPAVSPAENRIGRLGTGVDGGLVTAAPSGGMRAPVVDPGLTGAPARHYNCTLDASCTKAAPCNWSTAANWDDNGFCNGTYPSDSEGNTYTATIPAGRYVVLSANNLILGSPYQAVPALIIAGTVAFDPSAANRGPAGFRSLILVPSSTHGGVTINSGGALKMRGSDRILFNTAMRSADVLVNDGGTLDVDGSVVDTRLTAVAPITSNNAAHGCGTDDKQYYTVGVENGIEHAKTKRRILFKSGQLRNRQYEIVSVTGTAGAGSIGFCTDRADATSANDECTAASTPYACCLGDGIGTCTLGQRLRGHITAGTFPDGTPSANTRHWTPADTPDNDICTAAMVPHAYCTGYKTGTGSNIAPAAGDQVSIIDDAWFAQVAGTSEFNIRTGIGGNSLMPLLRAANIAGGQVSLASTGIGTESAFDLLYLNVHDTLSLGSSLIGVTGFRNYAISWNACHDNSGNPGAGCISPVSTRNWRCPCPDNVRVTDNVIYRTFGNGINFQPSTEIPSAIGADISRNLVFEGCTATAPAECGGIEVNACKSCTVTHNVVYDYIVRGAATDSSQGDCFRSGSDYTTPTDSLSGTVHAFNWLVNCGGSGFSFDSVNGSGASRGTATHNYVSNVYKHGGNGGRYFSNVMRNWDIGRSNSQGTLYSPLLEGNFFVGADQAAIDGGYCINGCGSAASLQSPHATYNASNPHTLWMDNVFTQSSSLYPGPLKMEGAFAGDVDISHWTIDLNGAAGYAVDLSGLSPDTPIAVNMFDLAATHSNDFPLVRCSESAMVTDAVGSFVANQSPVRSERTSSHLSGTCAAAGASVSPGADIGFRDRENLDYNYLPGSPALTGGAYPAGSALGCRAFHFDKDAIDRLWGRGLPWDLSAGDPTGGTITPFPKDIANGVSNVDTDGDGVMDLHDNCREVWNPAQMESIGDGLGSPCDLPGSISGEARNRITGEAIERAWVYAVASGVPTDASGRYMIPGLASGQYQVYASAPGYESAVYQLPVWVDPGTDTRGIEFVLTPDTESDTDEDAVPDLIDNCLTASNPDQANADGDAFGDACDCAPQDPNDPPRPVGETVTVSQPGTTDALIQWSAEWSLGTFGVYRGQRAAVGPFAYDHRCLGGPITAPVATDAEVPASGQAFYYLVTNIGCSESSLGTDSAGAPRPNPVPCPALEGSPEGSGRGGGRRGRP